MCIFCILLYNFQFAKRKQTELEDYQGVVFEGSDNPQKKRKIIQVFLFNILF